MDMISPMRLFLALFSIVGGAMIAAQIDGGLAQFIFMTAAGILAITIIIYGKSEPSEPGQSFLERQKEKHLKKGRLEGFRDAIANISDPILLIRDAKVAMANLAAETILGNHIVGEDVRVAIRHPAAAERLANPDAEHTGKPTLLVGVGSTNQRWELSIHELPGGFKLVQLSDQSASHAAGRMRTDFVANASHELRTPLAAIKGFIETLEDPEAGKDDDTRARFLKIMFGEADRMQRLVEDLMSLSRIEAEKYRLPSEPVDLRKLISEMQSFFSSSSTNKDSIELHLPDSMPLITGDRAQLTQLLHNLVSNARKYGKKSTPITIKVRESRSGSMLKLSVINQGEPIEAKHIPRLTERFYRIDKGRSKASGGTGLGLAIVKHITERHGGRMEITSEPKEGTTVAISLPIANGSPA